MKSLRSKLKTIQTSLVSTVAVSALVVAGLGSAVSSVHAAPVTYRRAPVIIYRVAPRPPVVYRYVPPPTRYTPGYYTPGYKPAPQPRYTPGYYTPGYVTPGYTTPGYR